MSSEVMRLAFGREQYPADAMQAVLPSSRVRQASHYMAAMGLLWPTDSPGIPGPLLESSCNDCMMCANCFPKLGPYTMCSPDGGGEGVMHYISDYNIGYLTVL